MDILRFLNVRSRLYKQIYLKNPENLKHKYFGYAAIVLNKVISDIEFMSEVDNGVAENIDFDEIKEFPDDVTLD